MEKKENLKKAAVKTNGGKKNNEIPPNVPTPNKKTRDPSDMISTLIGLSVIFGIPYYFFVWKKFPDSQFRWIIPLLVIIIAFAVYIYKISKTFKNISKVLIVLLIITGATIITTIFSPQPQLWIFKIFIILYFSLLPPWLYLQFITTKGQTLWDEYVYNLYRLKIDDDKNLPPKPQEDSNRYENEQNFSEVTGASDKKKKHKSIYEKKFEGLYWELPTHKDDIHERTFSAFRGENIWPVAFATLLISIGWIMVIQPESLFNYDFIQQKIDLFSKQNLSHEAFSFGFVGAYFYILQMLVRRYFQNDLKTSAYVNSIMRIIIVMLLVWIIDLIWYEELTTQLCLLAFVIGVFPYIGWQILLALIKVPFKLLIPKLREQFPLNDLDGLNIWYESRLMEEGIEDLQNLATANLVDVMLNTRIPIERLVDWIDQAILYLHLGAHTNENYKTNRDKLRLFGIRTATDLKDAFDVNNLDDTMDENKKKEHIEKLENIIKSGENEPSILRSILSTLNNESNFYHVEEWKKAK